MGKICVIIGTRPEIIKMSPVVRACERQEGSDWFVLHTGQHYSYGMDRVFFEQPGLPDARCNLDCGSGSGRHGEQTGRMMVGIEKGEWLVRLQAVCGILRRCSRMFMCGSLRTGGVDRSAEFWRSMAFKVEDYTI